MKKKCKYIITIMLFCMLFVSACKENSNKENETQNEIATGSDSDEKEDSLMPITREYFENVNRDYKIEDIVNEIGPSDGVRGSGIIYYYWNLEDGVEARIVFSSPENLIERITISYPDKSFEDIYNRKY